jgi:hypothetical protein
MTLYHILQLTALFVGPCAAIGYCGDSAFWISLAAAVAGLVSGVAAGLLFWRLGERVPRSEIAIGAFYFVSFAGVAGTGLVTTLVACSALRQV